MNLCSYCGMPVLHRSSYHERGDCQESIKTYAAELLELIDVAASIVESSKPFWSAWTFTTEPDQLAHRKRLVAAVAKLKDLGVINGESR